MDFSFSDLNLQLDGLAPINFNSVETLPGFEACAASRLSRRNREIVCTFRIQK